MSESNIKLRCRLVRIVHNLQLDKIRQDKRNKWIKRERKFDIHNKVSWTDKLRQNFACMRMRVRVKCNNKMSIKSYY